MAIIATMLIASSFVDEARRFVSELDSVWLWSVSFLSLAYAVFDTKDTWDEIKIAKKFGKSLPCLKMLLLWTIPIVGVLGAWSAEVNSKSAQEELRQFNVKLEAMRGENAKLEAIGEKAKESAAIAIKAAEEAKKEREIAETGRLELQATVLKLEEKVGGRTINETTKNALVNALWEIPKGKIELVTFQHDTEANVFAKRIQDALIAADCKVTINARTIFNLTETGLVLSVHDSSNPPLFSRIILRVLRQSDIKADGWYFNDGLGSRDLQIFVGARPTTAKD